MNVNYSDRPQWRGDHYETESIPYCAACEKIIEDIAHDFCGWCGSPLSDPTPLTLEELRGMSYEWVWVELFRDGKCIYCGYGYIIQIAPLSARILPENPGYATESDLLKGNAKFYTHKPKDGEK